MRLRRPGELRQSSPGALVKAKPRVNFDDFTPSDISKTFEIIKQAQSSPVIPLPPSRRTKSFRIENVISTLAWALIAVAVPLFYQSCDRTLIQHKAYSNGHLSVTTSSRRYDFNKGHIDGSIEKYDEIYGTGTVDFLHPIDTRVSPLTSHVGPKQKFVLLLTNANLNPGAIVQINDVYFYAQDYQKKTLEYIAGDSHAIPVMTLGQLTKLRVFVNKNAFINREILATGMDCVATNRPGPRGEYRNGALVIQAVARDNLSFDRVTHAAGRAAKTLWEAAVFQQKPSGQCY